MTREQELAKQLEELTGSKVVFKSKPFFEKKVPQTFSLKSTTLKEEDEIVNLLEENNISYDYAAISDNRLLTLTESTEKVNNILKENYGVREVILEEKDTKVELVASDRYTSLINTLHENSNVTRDEVHEVVQAIVMTESIGDIQEVTEEVIGEEFTLTEAGYVNLSVQEVQMILAMGGTAVSLALMYFAPDLYSWIVDSFGSVSDWIKQVKSEKKLIPSTANVSEEESKKAEQTLGAFISKASKDEKIKRASKEK